MLFDQNLPSSAAPKHSYSRVFWTLHWALGLGIALTTQAGATPQDSIKQAIQAGQLEQALKMVQQERQNTPKDAQMRFLEGVIQAQQGQTDKAIDTFKKLTESNPDLSEAYNNLGVLYAAKGKLEESRANLEKALQTHPSYAAAHRNLADVQSQLAKQTYAKALQVDSKVKNSTPQLTLLGSIDAPKRLPAATVIAAAPSPASAPATAPVAAEAETPKAAAAAITALKPTTVSPPVTVVPPPAAAAKPVSSGATSSVTAATKPVPPPPAAPVVAAPKPEPTPPKDDKSAKQAKADAADIRSAVAAWAKAWSQKDMNRYLAAYGSSFTPPEKMTRAKWESDRRLRILSKKTISVDIKNLKIEVSGSKATAQFQQIYESDNFKGNSHKTLELLKQGERWLITRETVN